MGVYNIPPVQLFSKCCLSSDSSDYDFESVTLLFSASRARDCSRIRIVNDGIDEDNETFTVSLSTADSDATLNPDSSIVTILDDDGKTYVY